MPRPTLAQTVAVDMELCLAADGSGSIAEDEFRFQRSGYAAAVADPRILDVMRSGQHGRIALALMEWGGAESMNEIVGWTVISDVGSAEAFGARVEAGPRLAFGWNSISNAIAFCQQWLDANSFAGTRQVIDVSGDAGQRGGMPLPIARQRAIDAGITINALALNFRGGGMTGAGRRPANRPFRAGGDRRARRLRDRGVGGRPVREIPRAEARAGDCWADPMDRSGGKSAIMGSQGKHGLANGRPMSHTLLRLHPGPPEEVELLGLYLRQELHRRGSPEAPFVYADFVSSLDGRIAIADRVPAELTAASDIRLLLELQAQADCVITHAGYLRAIAEGRLGDILQIGAPEHGRDLRDWRTGNGLPEQPTVAIASASLDFPMPASLAGDASRVLIATTRSAPAAKRLAWETAAIASCWPARAGGWRAGR